MLDTSNDVNLAEDELMMLELPDDIHSKVNDLCKQGDDLVNLGSYEDAKARYIAALDLLPGKPRE